MQKLCWKLKLEISIVYRRPHVTTDSIARLARCVR